MNLFIQLECADEFAYATAALQTVVFMRMTQKYWIGRAKRLACERVCRSVSEGEVERVVGLKVSSSRRSPRAFHKDIRRSWQQVVSIAPIPGKTSLCAQAARQMASSDPGPVLFKDADLRPESPEPDVS